MFFTTKIKSKNKEKESVSADFIGQKTLSMFNKDKENMTYESLTYESLRQKVRELAYSKWEQAGHPWGRDKEFWIEAEKELFGENPLVNGGYRIKSNGSYILICPLNSEVPVEVQFEDPT